MKKLLLLLLPFFFTSCSSSDDEETETLPAEPVKVMTFNIRYDNHNDNEHQWKNRKDSVAKAILFYSPDVLGTQEVLYNQLENLKKRLPGYGVVGVGRDDGKQSGEYSALWYKTERFDLIESGNFWLSQTPDVAGSIGWDAACVRIATWARLKDKNTGRYYFALNTHLDHRGKEAREKSVGLLLDRINRLSKGQPVIVTGDFNSDPSTDVIYHLTERGNSKALTDTRLQAPVVKGPSWSFHDFGQIPVGQRPLLDYIFIRNGLKALEYEVLAGEEDGFYLSDHAPIIAIVK